ncbi:MAG: glycosyltransferase family 2 protein [Parvularculaceae bacterium]|nr:glycosyltransferase family 2 protein [Parvularculaceae bacterium]
MTGARRFGAVIVNYNCAPLALDAALSFLGAGGAKAVIVDNASTDDSAAFLRRVLSGDERHTPDAPCAPLAGGAVVFADPASVPPGALTLMKELKNDGFASGSNIGLRALSAHSGIDRYLLLNPDALVARGALSSFSRRLDDAAAGLCGATVVGFDAPHSVQAFGGASFNRLSLTGRNLGQGADPANSPERKSVEARLAYPLGAAIALRKDYLARAGYLDERYFLYYEEVDWAFAGGSALRPVWAPGAIVYHRYGAASKSVRTSPDAPSERSALSDYHMARSRRLFAAKWAPALFPSTIALGAAQAARRAMRGRRENAAAVFRGAMPGSSRTFA